MCGVRVAHGSMIIFPETEKVVQYSIVCTGWSAQWAGHWTVNTAHPPSLHWMKSAQCLDSEYHPPSLHGMESAQWSGQ